MGCNSSHLQPKYFNIETVVELGCGYGDFINSVKPKK